jgi:hypothetical protein
MPFSNSHHNAYSGSSFPYGLEGNDGGSDSKQRKRRGNLPKETTDKLRAWFVAHLQHPYPTEDEKQELMRQTGLQMSMFPPNILIFIADADFLNRSNIQLVYQCAKASTAGDDQQCSG